MKILVFDVPAIKGGALTILKNFFEYVNENPNNHKWYFVVSTDELKANDMNVHIILEKFPKKNWFNRVLWELFIAHKLVNKIKPDIILSFQNAAIMFTKIPQIVYVHQSVTFCKEKKWSYFSLKEIKSAFYRDLYKLLIDRSVRKAHTVIVQTDWMKDALIDSYHLPKNKVRVIPPSVNVPGIERNFKVKTKSIRDKFFYPAGPGLYKNFEVIIEAVKKLLKQKYNLKVYLTIKGNENKYTIRIKKILTGIEDNFELIGYIPKEKVFEFYQNSTLIFPSYLETFGLPLLEARVFNTPIIASDRPFAREVLEGYPNVDFFDPFSPDDLADKMKGCLEGKTLNRSFMSTDEEAEILEEYRPENTWGKIVKLLEEVYKGI